ncbi:MAG: diacylglycerol kinase family protein [Ignavibacteria bacterium]
MKISIVINDSSGSTEQQETEKLIKEAFDEVNIHYDLFFLKGNEIENKIKNLITENPDAIVCGGGDGTVSIAAGILSQGKIPLGVLPLGTLNHFAKDIGMPLDIKEAAKVIARNRIQKIDIAEVNGRRFINNSSIGLYPHIVKKRDIDQKENNRSKWVAMFFASIATLKNPRLYNVTIKTNEDKAQLSTLFIFVGNNKYIMKFFNPGTRDRLDEGLLTLCITRCKTRWCMIRLTFKALFNKLQEENDFEMHFVEEVTLDTGNKKLSVSMDGEVVKLSSPLTYKILPKILSVIVPERKG